MITLTDPTANTDLSNMRGKITAYISGNTDVGDTSTIQTELSYKIDHAFALALVFGFLMKMMQFVSCS